MDNTECTKEEFKIIRYTVQKGCFLKVERCENCEKKCERLTLPTTEERMEWNS